VSVIGEIASARFLPFGYRRGRASLLLTRGSAPRAVDLWPACFAVGVPLHGVVRFLSVNHHLLEADVHQLGYERNMDPAIISALYVCVCVKVLSQVLTRK
jgi:hypothetical protein